MRGKLRDLNDRFVLFLVEQSQTAWMIWFCILFSISQMFPHTQTTAIFLLAISNNLQLTDLPVISRGQKLLKEAADAHRELLEAHQDLLESHAEKLDAAHAAIKNLVN